jgi:hypothetical protein
VDISANKFTVITPLSTPYAPPAVPSSIPKPQAVVKHTYVPRKASTLDQMEEALQGQYFDLVGISLRTSKREPLGNFRMDLDFLERIYLQFSLLYPNFY